MTLTAAQLAPDLPHGLAGSLEGVAHELGLLQTQVLYMQEACSASDMGAALDAVVIRELQALDLVTQQLEALSGFVRAIARATPFDPAIDLTDALNAITLHDLSQRLASQALGQGATEPIDTSPGDFDLF